MEIPKDQILELLRSRGEDDKVEQADQQLPDQVDPDEHAGSLEGLGLDPKELLAKLGGLGDLGGKLGL